MKSIYLVATWLLEELSSSSNISLDHANIAKLVRLMAQLYGSCQFLKETIITSLLNTCFVDSNRINHQFSSGRRKSSDSNGVKKELSSNMPPLGSAFKYFMNNIEGDEYVEKTKNKSNKATKDISEYFNNRSSLRRQIDFRKSLISSSVICHLNNEHTEVGIAIMNIITHKLLQQSSNGNIELPHPFILHRYLYYFLLYDMNVLTYKD